MSNHLIRIDDSKLVLKAAQAVWAANKYFVLACSQQGYLQIRRELRPDELQLEAAYHTLKDVYDQFSNVKTEQLPQLTNALYHVAGYFKKRLPNDKRQQIDYYIRTSPTTALESLEKYTFDLHINYLQISTLWEKNRTTPFNNVPVEITHKKRIYRENQLLWKGNYVLLNQGIE